MKGQGPKGYFSDEVCNSMKVALITIIDLNQDLDEEESKKADFKNILE